MQEHIDSRRDEQIRTEKGAPDGLEMRMKLGNTRLLHVCQTQVDWRGPGLAWTLGNLGDLLEFNVASPQKFCSGLRD